MHRQLRELAAGLAVLLPRSEGAAAAAGADAPGAGADTPPPAEEPI
jgi:hypothetical protein